MDQSFTWDPNIIGVVPLELHSNADEIDCSLFSPGTLIDGSEFPNASGGGNPDIILTDSQVDENAAVGS